MKVFDICEIHESEVVYMVKITKIDEEGIYGPYQYPRGTSPHSWYEEGFFPWSYLNFLRVM
jgi:hypothetical protein